MAEFYYMARGQMVDPRSGEVIARDRQLLDCDDVERILYIEQVEGDKCDGILVPLGGWNEYLDFRCHWCGAILKGYQIEIGGKCACVDPAWVMVGDDPAVRDFPIEQDGRNDPELADLWDFEVE